MAGLELTEGAILAALGGLAGYVGRLIETIVKGRPSRKDLMEAAGEIAMGLMEGMREDIDALRARVAAQDAEIAELKTAHDVCTSENQALQSALNQQVQRTESLAAYLRRQGLDVPDLTGARPLIVLTAPAPQGDPT